jgi:hypothetical protein
MKTEKKGQLVDTMVDAYVDWREESLTVWDAYRRWPAGSRLAVAPRAAAAEA